MQNVPMLFTFWPGLPQLWLQGRRSGLLKAIAFAAFLNFVLFATYQRPELVSKSGLIGCWIVLGLSWTVAIFHNDWVVKEFERKRGARGNSEELDQLFRMGQSEYLMGHLDQAANLFERILRLEPRDADATMYLATIHRHLGRLHQATRLLDSLESESQSEKWTFQIEDERALISELESELNADSRQEFSVKLSDDSSVDADTLPAGERHSPDTDKDEARSNSSRNAA